MLDWRSNEDCQGAAFGVLGLLLGALRSRLLLLSLKLDGRALLLFEALCLSQHKSPHRSCG